MAGANIGPLMRKRATIKGSSLRSRSAEYQGHLLHRFKEEALPLIVDGTMKVEVHEVKTCRAGVRSWLKAGVPMDESRRST